MWKIITLLLLSAAASLYARGWIRLRRDGLAVRVLGASRPSCFVGGMAVLAAALLSPLDTLAEQLFCAHMAQHLLLMLAAPPLLVWSRPALVFLWALPLPWRRRFARPWASGRWLRQVATFLMRPLAVWCSATFALWFWHIPGPYRWAMDKEAIHAIEHLMFFLTSLAFWTLTIPSCGGRKTGRAIALLMLVAFALHSGMLGALLTFAPAPIYRAPSAPAFGITALEDQQLAGLIMWVPATAVYLAALAQLIVSFLRPVPASRLRPRA